MKRDFAEWLLTFTDSIANYRYYIDFETIYKNAEIYKVELNMLNSLIGSKNIENDFEKLVNKYPEVIKCIPILLAVRQSEIIVLYTFSTTVSKLYIFLILSKFDFVTAISISFASFFIFLITNEAEPNMQKLSLSKFNSFIILNICCFFIFSPFLESFQHHYFESNYPSYALLYHNDNQLYSYYSYF